MAIEEGSHAIKKHGLCYGRSLVMPEGQACSCRHETIRASIATVCSRGPNARVAHGRYIV